MIANCQMFLRVSMGIIMASFVLIIVLTTLSTGEFVRIGGKALYYVIVCSILVSLGVWLYRVKLEKRARIEEDPR
jgi:uncharacterized membrane protein